MIYDDESQLYIGNRPMKIMIASSSFTYLGATFTTTGLRKIEYSKLKQDLELIMKSPSKPQQKIFTIRNFFYPKVLPYFYIC